MHFPFQLIPKLGLNNTHSFNRQEKSLSLSLHVWSCLCSPIEW